MNPPAIETPTLPLDPATLAAMQSAVLDALPPRPGATEAQKATQRECALTFFASLLPRDPVQAMLAVHIVASHYAVVECYRRAGREDVSHDLVVRILAKAVALCRMIDRNTNDLARRQGIPMVRPVARVAPVPAVQAQAGDESVRASAPGLPPVAENRHARRRREYAEQRLAKAAQRAGMGSGVVERAMQQRVAAEVAGRAAIAARAVAA